MIGAIGDRKGRPQVGDDARQDRDSGVVGPRPVRAPHTHRRALRLAPPPATHPAGALGSGDTGGMGDGAARYVTGLVEAFGRNADRPAVIHRGRTVSYGELLGRVYRVARVWDELGIRHGEGVFCVLG